MKGVFLSLILFLFFFSGASCDEKKPLIYFVAPSMKGHLLPVVDAAKVLRQRNYEIFFISDAEAGPLLKKENIPHAIAHIPGGLNIVVKADSFSQFINRLVSFGEYMGKVNFFLYLKTIEEIQRRKPDFIFYEIFGPFIGELAREKEIPALLYIPGPISALFTPWQSPHHPPSILNQMEMEPLEQLSLSIRIKSVLINMVLSPLIMIQSTWILNQYRGVLNLPSYSGSFIDWLYLNKRHPLVSPVPFPLDAPHLMPPFLYKIPPLLSSLSANWSAVEPRVKEWIDSHNLCQAERKLIYVSFGSVWSPRKTVLIKLLHALIQLKRHNPQIYVLWARASFALESNNFRIPVDLGDAFNAKYTAEISTLREWMLLEEFVTQKAILQLCRDDLLMYVTHCGASSTVEGMVNAIPLFGLPIEADQYFNAARIRKLGLGDAVHVGDEEGAEKKEGREIYERLSQFMDEKQWKKFRENERKVLRSLHLEGNNSGDLLAAFVRKHIENPILNDMKYFAPFDIDWPWWKARSFDVLYVSLMIVMSVFVVIGFLLYGCVKVLKYCCGGKQKSKKKKGKTQ